MNFKCSCCKKQKNIFWKDFYREIGPIRLCWSCLEFLGWTEEQEKFITRIQTCGVCRDKYLPNNNKSNCVVCYFKSKGKIKTVKDVVNPVLDLSNWMGVVM